MPEKPLTPLACALDTTRIHVRGLQARQLLLALELIKDVLVMALDMACQVLKPKGSFVAKVFHGEGYDEYVKTVRESFDKVVIRKPDSSRARSREVYLVAKGFRVA